MAYATLREKIAAESAERRARYAAWERLVAEARVAATAAADAATPSPMVVRNMDGSLVDVVQDGPCGFAWVNVADGRSSFARWAVKEQKARRDSYYGGVTFWCDYGAQSLARNEAWALKFAERLRDGGVKATAHSRID